MFLILKGAAECLGARMFVLDTHSRDFLTIPTAKIDVSFSTSLRVCLCWVFIAGENLFIENKEPYSNTCFDVL